MPLTLKITKSSHRVLLLLSFALLGLSGCSETQYAAHLMKKVPFSSDTPKTVGYYKVGNPYKIKGRKYYPEESYNFTETGMASWYGPNFHGKMTANGEIFDRNELTAAHRTLQMPSIIRVTNLSNGRSIILRVNDRGPFAHDRVLDVSERAASVLGFKNQGTTKVKIEVLPEPSRQVASMAKSGQATTGFEVALNQNKYRTRTAAVNNTPEATPIITPNKASAPVTEVRIANQNQSVSVPDNLMRNPMPVQAEPLNRSAYSTTSNITNITTGEIYVQAGSFSAEQNALNFSNRLASIGPSKVYMTRVNDAPFFRVRMGPYADRAQASQAISMLQQNGHGNAVIVVD